MAKEGKEGRGEGGVTERANSIESQERKITSQTPFSPEALAPHSPSFHASPTSISTCERVLQVCNGSFPWMRETMLKPRPHTSPFPSGSRRSVV